MKPLFKYQGSKTPLLKRIKDRMPRDFGTNSHLYIEPFVGGGALYFDLLPKLSILNDLDRDVAWFYKLFSCENVNSPLFHRLLIDEIEFWDDLNNDGKDEWYYTFRDNYNDYRHTKRYNVKSAVYWWFLRELMYNGTWRQNKDGFMNQPFGKYYSKNLKKKHLKNMEWLEGNTVKGVTIYNQDYRNIVEIYKHRTDAFWFIDPPYKSKLGYPEAWNEREYENLSDTLKLIQGNWMLVIPKDKQSVELFKEYNIDNVTTRYKRYTKGKAVGTTHLLIIRNYEV